MESNEMGSEKNADFYNNFNTDENFLNKIERIYKPVYEKVISLIDFNKNPRILDIGSGVASLVKYLKIINYKNYTGVDFADKLLEFSRKRFPEYKFIHGNLTDTNFLKKTFINFDVFVCLEVLEHINSDLTIIEQIPKGKDLIFSVPNFDAKGHVRIFKNKNEIKNRYMNLLKFDDNCIFKIPRKKTEACFFLSKTIIKE
ncbi:MAG: class I SAM-dependent methyltransferase [Patescibacteria group bacterium]